MSLLERIKEIIAGKADGHHKALLHVAAEVDSLASEGVPAADLESLKGDLAAKIDACFGNVSAVLDNALEEFAARLAELETNVAKLSPPALVAPQPAAQATAPLASDSRPAHAAGANRAAPGGATAAA
jgi:hypothetical protein